MFMRPRSARQRLADLFWILFTASLALDVYAMCTLQENDFYAAACVSGAALLSIMAGDGDE